MLKERGIPQPSGMEKAELAQLLKERGTVGGTLFLVLCRGSFVKRMVWHRVVGIDYQRWVSQKSADRVVG